LHTSPSRRLALPPPPSNPIDDDDFQIALLICYELHYRSFRGVDPAWEWYAPLLEARADWERSLLEALRGRVTAGADAIGVLDEIESHRGRGGGVADHLLARGTWAQAREYFAHRSIYQLKEADPYVWIIPRLRGKPKAALTAVEFDELGAGRGEQVHAHLFERLLDAAGLDSRYLAYLDDVPAATMLLANVVTLFGLHRALLGAAIGHFAVTELTTGPSARRLERALTRLGAPRDCVRFYTEHVEADAVHEQVLRHDVVQCLLLENPDLDADIAFGITVANLVEDAVGEYLLDAWDSGRSSLLSAG
jgi:hypothetical protein